MKKTRNGPTNQFAIIRDMFSENRSLASMLIVQRQQYHTGT